MNNEHPGPVEHIGVELWTANRHWMEQFTARVRAAGFPEFTIPRANLLGHVDRQGGTRQADLVKKSGFTKQAVNQMIRDLVASGLVKLDIDPDDNRAKRIVFTSRGHDFFVAVDQAKIEIQECFSKDLGDKRYGRVRAGLRELIDAFQRLDR